MGQVRKFCGIILLLALAGCQKQQEMPAPVQRISFSEIRSQPLILLSPDTSKAQWTVAPDGRAVDFGTPGEPPLISLACRLGENPPELRIMRHAPARPGQKAMFPVIGNGMISRFKLDVRLNDGEWRWEGSLPAEHRLFDVFSGTRDLEATLPGAGSVQIAGSRIPGEFVDWCRAGGQLRQAEAEEQQEEAGQAA